MTGVWECALQDLTLDWSIITWLKTICNLPIIAKVPWISNISKP